MSEAGGEQGARKAPSREGAAGARWRLFVALDPPPSLTAALAESLAEARPLAPDARWSQAEKLHLTLAFLGHLPADRVEPIRAALARAAARHGPPAIHLGGAGTFGRGARARVLWLGVDGGEALQELQAAVAAGLEAAIGYHEDRPYRPHLTLARAREPRGSRDLLRARDALAALDLGSFPARELLLYRSELSPGGALYTQLATFPLGA